MLAGDETERSSYVEFETMIKNKKLGALNQEIFMLQNWKIDSWDALQQV